MYFRRVLTISSLLLIKTYNFNMFSTMSTPSSASSLQEAYSMGSQSEKISHSDHTSSHEASLQHQDMRHISEESSASPIPVMENEDSIKQESADQKVKKSKSRKPRNNSHKTVRTIIKEMDSTYKANALKKDIPLKRQHRAAKAAKERGISTRNIYAWSKSTEKHNLIKYAHSTRWTSNLFESFKDKKANVSNIPVEHDMEKKPPRLADRKQKAQDLAHLHYHRMMRLAQNNTAQILQTPNKYRGTYTPKKPSTIILLDMTKDNKVRDALSLYLRDVTEMDGDVYGTLFVPLSGNSISVSVLITKFNSYLDNPQTAWKSVKGTKKSTVRLYQDREGIHTGALQDLDAKVERSEQGFKAKMIVVNDEDIDMSSLSDVVHTGLENLFHIIASRVRDMGLHYVE